MHVTTCHPAVTVAQHNPTLTADGTYLWVVLAVHEEGGGGGVRGSEITM
jgi:hypothetical protein